jgi:[ribosomal protein S18]-alanine N-acetyltransferase
MTKPDISGNFIIREYRTGDFEGISHLWKITNMASQKRGDDEKTIEDTIRLGGSLKILEEKNTGRISGTSWMTFDGRRIHLHHFGILPEFQGHGLSKILIRESLNFVKAKGYQVKLEVHKSNNPAVNLYKKSGFQSLGDYEVYIIRDISKLLR